MAFIVAIDGPTSSGKSTVSKLISSELNFTYVQTGAMYRCVAMEMLNEGIALDDEDGIRKLLDSINIQFKNIDEKQLIFLNNKEVTDEIRSKEVTDYTSSVASITEVRSRLIDKQREIAKNGNIIMEGRDIGTNVFPNADIKFFLNAKAIVRAERRQKELEAKGQKLRLTEVLESMYKWDKEAVQRKEGALKRAEDSIYIDTSELNIQELGNKMLPIIREKYNDKFNEREI